MLHSVDRWHQGRSALIALSSVRAQPPDTAAEPSTSAPHRAFFRCRPSSWPSRGLREWWRTRSALVAQRRAQRFPNLPRTEAFLQLAWALEEKSVVRHALLPPTRGGLPRARRRGREEQASRGVGERRDPASARETTMVTRDLRSSPARRKPLLPDDPEYQAELRRTYVEWTSGVDLLFGMWLVVSPWVLGYTGAAAWTDVAVGLAIVSSAWLQVRNPAHMVGLAWVNFALGAWLVVAPFVLTGV